MAKSEVRVANLVNTVNLTVKFFKNLLLVASCYFFLAEIKEASKANWIKESVVIRQVNILEDWAVWLPSSRQPAVLNSDRGVCFQAISLFAISEISLVYTMMVDAVVVGERDECGNWIINIGKEAENLEIVCVGLFLDF